MYTDGMDREVWLAKVLYNSEECWTGRPVMGMTGAMIVTIFIINVIVCHLVK